MSTYEEIIDLLEKLFDSDDDYSFGNNDFTISDLCTADNDNDEYQYTYTPFLGESKEYNTQSIEELYDQLHRIYSYFNKCGVPSRLLNDLKEASSD